jgi:hypothetical protein
LKLSTDLRSRSLGAALHFYPLGVVQLYRTLVQGTRGAATVWWSILQRHRTHRDDH